MASFACPDCRTVYKPTVRACPLPVCKAAQAGRDAEAKRAARRRRSGGGDAVH